MKASFHGLPSGERSQKNVSKYLDIYREAPKNPNRKIQDWANMAELLSDFNWADYLPWVWKARKEAEARLQAELAKQAAPQMA